MSISAYLEIDTEFNSLTAAGVKSIFQIDLPELKCVVLSKN